MLVEVVHELGQRTMVCEYDALWVWAMPMADSQLGVFAKVSGMAYENGILFST